jgi:KRAB domain-containing zinc finger protein
LGGTGSILLISELNMELKCDEDEVKVKDDNELDDEAQCAFCELKFESIETLKIHVLSEHRPKRKRKDPSAGKPTCQQCSKSFNDANKLKYHMMAHNGEKPHSCTECRMSFTEPSSLKRHMRTHTGEKAYQCKECDKSFSESRTLKNHMLSHEEGTPGSDRTHACDMCPSAFKTAKHLKTHSLTHSGERSYVCELCSKGFLLKQHLKTHFKKVHEKITVKCEQPLDSVMCIEPGCEKLYTEKKSMETHYRRAHLNEKFICAICAKEIACVYSLRDHMKVAHGTAPKCNKCRFCGKIFETYQILGAHMRRSHPNNSKRKNSKKVVLIDPEDPMKSSTCKDCGEMFSDNYKLGCHMRKVHRPPSTCKICYETFATFAQLIGHTKRIHRGEFKPLKSDIYHYKAPEDLAAETDISKKESDRCEDVASYIPKCNDREDTIDSKEVKLPSDIDVEDNYQDNPKCNEREDTIDSKEVKLPSDIDMEDNYNDYFSDDDNESKIKENNVDSSEASLGDMDIQNSDNHFSSDDDNDDNTKATTFVKKEEANLELHEVFFEPVLEQKIEVKLEYSSEEGSPSQNESESDSEDKTDQCNECGTVTTNLNNHMRRQHGLGKRRWLCDMCDYKTSKMDILVKHRRNKHDTTELSENPRYEWSKLDRPLVPKGKVGQCNECGAVCTDLPHHMQRQHRTVQFHFCDMCDFKTNRKDSLVSHKRTKHAKFSGQLTKSEMLMLEKSFVCDQCTFATTRADYLKEHMETHEGVRHHCDYCGQSYAQARNLKAHIINCHGDLEDLRCDQCDFTTKRKDTFEHHIKFKHEGVRHQCDVCLSSYSRSTDLKRHIKTVHTNPVEKVTVKHPCALCSSSFCRERDLRRHVRVVHADTKDEMF